MKIETAIKHLKEYERLEYEGDGFILDMAVRLGIEALERVVAQRTDHLSRYSELLPSETPVDTQEISSNRRLVKAMRKEYTAKTLKRSKTK